MWLKRPEEIVTDAEIERVHGHANFGSRSKRAVVDEGVLKRTFGYSCGATMRAILIEHGLIRVRNPFHEGSLTAKGRRYLRALVRETTIDALLRTMGRIE